MSISYIFNALQWFSRGNNGIGPVFKNGVLTLEAIRKCEMDEMPTLNQLLSREGSNLYDFVVRDGDGQYLGSLTCEMSEKGTAIALHDLVLNDEWRGKGYGRQVVQSLIANIDGGDLEIVDAGRESDSFWAALGVAEGGGDGVKKWRINKEGVKNPHGAVGKVKEGEGRDRQIFHRDGFDEKNSGSVQEKELAEWREGLNLSLGRMSIEFVDAGKDGEMLGPVFATGAQGVIEGRTLYLHKERFASLLEIESVVAKAHIAINGLDDGIGFGAAAAAFFAKNVQLDADDKEASGIKRTFGERLACYTAVELSNCLGWSEVVRAIAGDLEGLGLKNLSRKIKKELVDKPSVQLEVAKEVADLSRVVGQWLSDGAPAPAWACKGVSCVFFDGQMEHLNVRHELVKEGVVDGVETLQHIDELEAELYQAIYGDKSLFSDVGKIGKELAEQGLIEYFEAMPRAKCAVTRKFGVGGVIELSESKVLLRGPVDDVEGARYFAKRSDAIAEFWSLATPRSSFGGMDRENRFGKVVTGEVGDLDLRDIGLMNAKLIEADDAKALLGDVQLKNCMHVDLTLPSDWICRSEDGIEAGLTQEKASSSHLYAVFGAAEQAAGRRGAVLSLGGVQVNTGEVGSDGSVRCVMPLPDMLRLTKVRALVDLTQQMRGDKNSFDKIIHPTKEGVAQFYRWFEGSSVVDSLGRPLVLFHGTNSDMNTFDFERSRENRKVFMSPNSKMASEFALYRSTWSGANVLPVFAKANVLVVDGDGKGIREVEREFKAEDSLPNEGVYEYAKRHGLTGVCFKSVVDEVGPNYVGAQDVYAFFDGAEFKSALGNAGGFDKDSKDVRFSFAGENAKTIDIEKLALAGEMEREGADAKEIWQKTGFFRAPWDKKWRWEIDDSVASAEMKSGSAPDVLAHKGLFEAYPPLNSLRVDLKKLLGGKSGGYNENQGSISIDPSQAPEIIKPLLHEMQHAIQTQEGFEKGGTLDLDQTNADADIAKAMRDLLSVDYLAKQFSVKPEVAAKLGGFNEVTISTVKRWDDGGLWESNVQALKYETLPAMTRYWNSAGEVEARLVEYRKSLSEAERRAAFPLDQIDVPLSEILVGGKWLGQADDAGFDAEFEARASIAEQLAAQNLGVPVRMVMEVARLSESELKDRDAQRTNLVGEFDEPKTFKRYPLGSAMVDEYGGDFAGRYVSYLREFEPLTLATSEAEDRIKSHPSYAMYVKWSGDGIDPPYVAVNEGENGKLICTNRRRTLAAQETGRIIQGWFSPLNKVTGLPLKVADVHAAIAAAQEAIKAQPEKAANGIIACVDYAATEENRETANLLKGGSSKSAEAVARAAKAMAEKIGPDAILVPIPGRTGSATSTLVLAQAIGDIAGCTVADILSGVSRESTRSLRYEGIPATAKQMGFALKAQKPEGRIVLVDNVLATGTSVYAARKALGEDADVLVYAADSRVAYAPVDPDGEMDAVREKYAGTDMWLKAPNGDKSRLSERQWLMVRTPSFKSWFGDWENDPENASKAMGANGEPKVYYHGSDKSGFHEFETEPDNPKTRGTGSFFTDDYYIAASYIRRSNNIAVHLPEEILESPDLIDAVIEKGILVDVEMSSGRIERCFYQDIDAALADLTLEEGEDLEWVEGYQVLHDEEFIGTRGEVLEHLRGIESSYSGIYECFLNIRECMTYDWKGNSWDDTPDFEPEWCIYDPEGFPVDYLYSEDEVEQFKLENPELTIEKVVRDRSTDDVAREARMSGDDGVLLNDVDDSGPYGNPASGQVAVVFEAKNIKSAHNLGTFASTTNDIRFSFAGENASTVDLAMLAKAGEMERAGADVKEIWKETGFFRAPWDNKWRWEIDDSEGVWAQTGEKIDEYGTWPIYQNTGAVIDREAAIAVANNERVSVDGVLFHEKLYAAYPKGGRGLTSLGKTQVRQQTEKGASYGGRYITVNKGTLLDHGTYKDISEGRLLPEMLLHELQHSIQDREGFAKGGNPQQFDSKKAIWYRDCLWWRDQVEARALEQGFGIDSYQGLLKANDLVYSEYVAAGLEDLALDSKTREDALQFGFSQGGALREVGERNVVMYGLDKSISPTSELALYRRLAGEAEARLTMKRSQLSAAERRERFPLDDLDVPVDQLVVVGVENIQNEQVVTADTIDINGVQRPSRNSEGKLIHATTEQLKSEMGNDGSFNDDEKSVSSYVEPEREFIEVDGVLRRIKNSEGKLIHADDESVRNFWRWFGDSKAVDDLGRPLVVYHGTNQDFDEFMLGAESQGHTTGAGPAKGFFFSENPANASGWASAVAGRRDDETRAALADAYATKGNKAASKEEKDVASAFIKGYQEFIDGKVVYPAYVRLESPVEFDAKGRAQRDIPLSKTPDALLESAKKKKKDGVIIKNLFDAPVPGWGGPWTATQFAVLEPYQVKSALSNSGLFSTQDANIMRYVESERSAKERFVYAELQRLSTPEYKGREKVIEMKIDDFLGLASDGMQAFKMENAQSILDQGGVFSTIPYLYAKEDGDVIGHEGRHRAMALKAAGYDTMPVELRMSHLRWSQQNDPDDFDYVAEWPKSLRAQKDARDPEFEIPFPVSREQANESYFDAAPAANGELPDTVIINGVERATRNNEGALIHPTADGIYNFWEWYGSNGIVDDQGRPKVFYHGSATPDDLRSFVPGGVYGDAQKGDMYGIASYFTDDRNQASAYAEVSDGEGAGAVFPVYLRGELLNQDKLLDGADAERIGGIAAKWATGADRARLAQTRKQAIFAENDKDAAEQFFREKREEWLARGEGMERSRPVVEDGKGDWVISYTDFDMPLTFETGKDVLSWLNGIGYENSVALGFDGLVLNKESGAQWVVHHRPAFNVKSAIGNNGNFRSNRREIALSFAGDKAYTADIASLSEAKSMVGRGQDPEFVRRKTGWHQGIDEKWRFEISDHEASIKKVPKVFESCGVDEILNHEKLFAAYPILREYTIRVGLNDKDDGPNGAHYANAKLITLTERVAESDELLSVLLHEIQHAIQSVEGFARGGNTDREFTSSVQHAISELNDEAKKRIESWKWYNSEKLDDAQIAAKKARYALMYESANRLVEYANRDKPSGVMRLIRNEIQWIYDPEFRTNDLARELQYRIYDIPKRSKMRERNQFLAQFALDAANLLRSEIPGGLLHDFRSDERTVKGMLNALQRQSSKASQALAPLRELEKDAKAIEAMAEAHRFSTSYSIYKSLAGEVESRNTERRMAMDDEQRKARSPESTEDVPRREQIVMSQDLQMLGGRRMGYSYSLSEPYPSLPVSMLTQDQMIARGADGHLAKAWERYIEIDKIDGLEPTPAASDDEGYRKGRIIKQPIEVVYEAAEDKYYLYGGNHRITQAKLNGDKFIRAFVQPDKGRIGKDATTSAEKAGLNKAGNDASFLAESDMPSVDQADWVLGASPNTINVDGVERSRHNSKGLPIHPTDEGLKNFWRWFGDSKTVDAEGRPIVFYHGTSKDKEFKSFKASERGLWFTSNPDDASMYARENDSMNMKYEDGRFIEVNTAARVLPVYLKVSNAHEITPEDYARCNVAGYARAQAQLNRELKMKGVDGTNWGGGTWVAFDPSQVKSAIGNVGSYDPKKKDIAFSFAGIKARTVDLDKLRAAGEMEKAGADARDIWEKTGFFRAPWDKQWRWEISDHEADLTLEPLKQIRFGGDVSVNWRMSDGMRHERLLAAYPELGSLKFKMDKLSEAELAGANGDFDERGFEIRLREFYGKAKDVSADELDVAVLNAERAINVFRSRPDFKHWSARLSAANQAVIDLHNDGAGEVAMDLAQAQVNILNAEYRDNFAKEEAQLVLALEAAQASRRAGRVVTLDHADALRVSLHEVQHAIQSVENFGRGAAPAMFSPDVSREFAEHMGEVNALFRLNGGVDGAEVSARAKQRFITLFGKEPSEEVTAAAATLTRGQIDSALLRINSGKSAYEKYLNSGGEVEARLTEKRHALTEEERRKRFPLDDLDVPVASIHNITGNEVKNGKTMCFAGIYAATFDPAKMLAAVEMENAGADARDIWAETGFFRAPWDKQWRFEIDDSQAAIKAGFAGGRTMPVSDALDHDELLKNYPAIGHMAVTAGVGVGGSSWFNKSSNTASIHLTGPDDEDVRVFIHEMQHAIQAAEQFASGGSYATKDELLGVIADEKRRLSFHDQLGSLYGEGNDLKRLARVYDWLNLSGREGLITVGEVKRTQEWQEHESSIVNKIGEMPEAGEKRQLWLREASWHVYLAEREELVRDIGGVMRKGGYKADTVLKVCELIKEAMPSSERAKVYQRLDVQEQKLSDLSAAEVYRRLAGEAEARLAEYRVGMSKEQRRSIFPLDQLDVSVNDMIVRTGGAGFSMSADMRGLYRIESLMRGVIGEQLELSLVARRNDNDAIIGAIDFSEYRGEVSVQMVSVVEGKRRNGVATNLAAALQNAYPGSEINFGYASEEGASWLKSLPFKVIDSPYADDFKRLSDLKEAEADLNKRIDELNRQRDGAVAAEEWKAALYSSYDQLNSIADDIYALEESTRWVKAKMKLIDVDAITGRQQLGYADAVRTLISATSGYKAVLDKAEQGLDVSLDEYEGAREQLLKAENATRIAMAEEVMEHGCVSGRNGEIEFLLHGSAKGDDRWQLTRMKNGVPIGDSSFSSLDEGCREMLVLSDAEGLGNVTEVAAVVDAENAPDGLVKRSDVVAAVREAFGVDVDADKSRIKVVQSIGDLPEDLKKGIRDRLVAMSSVEAGKGGNSPRGVVCEGMDKAYLIADGFKAESFDTDVVRRVVLHEGFHWLVGDGSDLLPSGEKIMMKVGELFDDGMQKIGDGKADEIQKWVVSALSRVPAGTPAKLVVEEFAAHAVEEADDLENGMFQSWKDQFAAAALRVGFLPSHLDDKALACLARFAVRELSGKTGIVDDVASKAIQVQRELAVQFGKAATWVKSIFGGAKLKNEPLRTSEGDVKEGGLNAGRAENRNDPAPAHGQLPEPSDGHVEWVHQENGIILPPWVRRAYVAEGDCNGVMAPEVISNGYLAGVATRYLSELAQENIVALVLDEKDRPITILRHSIGGVDSADIHAGILLGAIKSVEGAKSFWIAHNHPGGTMKLSAGDILTMNKLGEMSLGSGVRANGMLAVTDGGVSFAEYGAEKSSYSMAWVEDAVFNETLIHVSERVFGERSAGEGLKIDDENDVLNVLRGTGLREGAFLLMNSSNVLLSVVPMPSQTMLPMRNGGNKWGLILDEMSRSNASRAVVILDDEATNVRWENAFTALNCVGLDVASVYRLRRRENGWGLGRDEAAEAVQGNGGGIFFSVEDGALRHQHAVGGQHDMVTAGVRNTVISEANMNVKARFASLARFDKSSEEAKANLLKQLDELPDLREVKVVSAVMLQMNNYDVSEPVASRSVQLLGDLRLFHALEAIEAQCVNLNKAVQDWSDKAKSSLNDLYGRKDDLGGWYKDGKSDVLSILGASPVAVSSNDVMALNPKAEKHEWMRALESCGAIGLTGDETYADRCDMYSLSENPTFTGVSSLSYLDSEAREQIEFELAPMAVVAPKKAAMAVKSVAERFGARAWSVLSAMGRGAFDKVSSVCDMRDVLGVEGKRESSKRSEVSVGLDRV